MYDAAKIIPALAGFAALVTLPFWYAAVQGKPASRPDPQRPVNETKCVESKEYMKAWHMDLLNNWRDAVVRTGQRVYISSTGQKFEMNLSRGCLKCHVSREKFCDQCHNYVGADVYCWDCHEAPKGE